MVKGHYQGDIATAPAMEAAEPARLILHVIASGALTTYPLPPEGELTIGRGNDVRVRIDEPSISRRHVLLHVGAQLAIEDAGSANGTKVAGQRLGARERRAIGVGETVELGPTTTLVVLAANQSQAARPRRLLTHDFFEARLGYECEASELSHRPFCVARLSLGGNLGLEETRALLVEGLGPESPLAAYGPNEYEALLVGYTPEAAQALCDRLVTRLGGRGLGLRFALAAYPRDGRTAEALLDFACRGLRDRDTDGDSAIVVRDPVMLRLHRLAERVAGGNISVLLLGETGSGKEIFAEVIHRASPRGAQPLLRLNCAALAENLLESELFGHEKGAFTGAAAAKPGLLEAAAGGTVLLDEVGEMPLALQAKLLRVIQERKVLRVGALKPRAIDVRFIAATNRDLEREVAEGRFRQDLFYRLNGIALVIPPLRERPSEVVELAHLFLRRAAADLRRSPPALSPAALALLQGYVWPGNIRELHNVIERAVLLCGDEPSIGVEHLAPEKLAGTFAYPPPAPAGGLGAALGAGGLGAALGAASTGVAAAATGAAAAANAAATAAASGTAAAAVASTASDAAAAGAAATAATTRPAPAGDDERARIVDALERCNGNQTYAARLLGMARSTLVLKMTALGLPRPRLRGPR